MKRLTLILSMTLALIGFNANAAMYIVGNIPFGDWNPNAGVEMTDNGNGIYTYTATINGTVYFVFGDGLADWSTFNPNNRYGPANGNEAVTAGVWKTTQKAGDHGSYYFQGSGDDYVFTFDENNHQFKVEGYVEPVVFESFTVAGNNADIFGETWKPELADNDMTLDETDGLYKLVRNGIEITAGYTLEYKVVANHSWDNNWGKTPGGDNQDYYFEQAGTYNLTFKFDLENETVSLDAEKVADGPVVDDYYIVAGTANLFGSNWSATDTLNLMTESEAGFFTWIKEGFEATAGTEVEFKVVANGNWNTCWPQSDENGDNNWWYQFEQDGVYTVIIAFNEETKQIDLTATKTGDLPTPPEPEVDPVYIMGNVNGYTFDAIHGVEMTYDETNKVYNAEITVANAEGKDMGYFGFTKKLADAESETPWDDIEAYRFGPMSTGDFIMTEELLNTSCELAEEGHESIGIPAGVWTVTVDLVNNTFKVNGTWPSDTVEPQPTTPDVYIFGDVNNYAWDPTQGVLMTYNEGIYTAEVTTTIREGQSKAYFGFTKKLAEAESETPWDDIRDYRFGPVSEGAFTMTEELLGVECDLATDGSYESVALPEGTWTVNVDLEHNKFTVNGTWPVDTVVPEPISVYTVAGPEAIFGSNWDATDTNNDMTLVDGVYTWTKQNVELAAGSFEFKVVGNHSWDNEWPMGYGNNWVKAVEETGIYTITITYEPEAADSLKITCEIVKTGDIEPVHYDGDVYILGEVNDNGGWFPNVGVKMTRDAENNVYTATITTAGENIPEGEETGYSYFSFTKQLADSAADWEGIAPYRFGAVSEGDFWVTDEVLGTDIALTNGGQSFRVPAGEWNLTVSVDNMTLVITKKAKLGDVNGDGNVNITDVTALISAVLNDSFDDIIIANSDLTGEGAINISDVTALISLVLNS